jgi:hypothetical protein
VEGSGVEKSQKPNDKAGMSNVGTNPNDEA